MCTRTSRRLVLVLIPFGLVLGGCRRTPDARLEKGRTLGPALDAPAGAKWNSAAVEYDVDSRHTSTNTPFGHLSGEDWVVTHDVLIRHQAGESRIRLDQRVDCCRTSPALTELAKQRYELRTHPEDPAAVLVVRSDGKLGTLAARAPAAPVYCKHLPKDAASWGADNAASHDLLRDMLGARVFTDSPPEHRADSREFAHYEGLAALAAACAEPDDAELGLTILEWHLLRGRAMTEISLIEQALGGGAAREACLTNAVQKHERARQRLHDVLRARPPGYQERVRFVIATRALATAADEASQVALAEATRDALASEEVSAVKYGWPLVQELVKALARITQTRRRAPALVRQVFAGLGASTDVELDASRRLAAEGSLRSRRHDAARSAIEHAPSSSATAAASGGESGSEDGSKEAQSAVHTIPSRYRLDAKLPYFPGLLEDPHRSEPLLDFQRCDSVHHGKGRVGGTVAIGLPLPISRIVPSA